MTCRSLVARVAFALTITVAACGSDSTAPQSPGSAPVGGTYTLRSVNGSPLPYTVQQGTTKLDLLSSKLTIADGGTWTETPTFSVSINGGTPTTQVISSSGTYNRAGTSLALYTSTALYLTCTFDGNNTLTCPSALTYVYSK